MSLPNSPLQTPPPQPAQPLRAAEKEKKKSRNPRDGWKAFVVAICASLVQAVTFGISNSFPNFVFEMTMDDSLGYPTNSDLSIVQAVALGLSAILAVPAGFVVKKFGPRVANLISCVGLVASLLLSSFAANSSGALIGLYSLPMGISMAFMMSTGATATSSWFDKRAALGMGICFTGGGTGSLSVPRIAGALAASFSWRTSFQILASLCAIHIISTLFVCIRPADEEEDGEELVAIETEGGEVVNRNTNTKEANEAEKDNAPTSNEGEQLVNSASTHADNKFFNYHTHHASFKQLLFQCLLTRNFIGLFCCYAAFSLGFYAFLYVAVPFPLSMGTGPYATAAAISVDSASNVFVPFGVCQTLGGILNGMLATRTEPRLVFIANMGILAVTVAFYATCRALWEFLLVCAILGWGVSGFFATFGTMIAERFWGPNLSIIMSLAFAGAAFGGFLGAILSTEISNAENGDYTYATVMMSLSFFVAGLCVMFVVTDVETSDENCKDPNAVEAFDGAVQYDDEALEKEISRLIAMRRVQPSPDSPSASPLADASTREEKKKKRDDKNASKNENRESEPNSKMALAIPNAAFTDEVTDVNEGGSSASLVRKGGGAVKEGSDPAVYSVLSGEVSDAQSP